MQKIELNWYLGIFSTLDVFGVKKRFIYERADGQERILFWKRNFTKNTKNVVDKSFQNKYCQLKLINKSAL